jgi:hypothetical protein
VLVGVLVGETFQHVLNPLTAGGGPVDELLVDSG